MKIMALDVGDAWVGTAISDGLGITCAPYETVGKKDLSSFLLTQIKEKEITTIIIGLPITMSGQESSQTKKIIEEKELLEKELTPLLNHPVSWLLWNERLSSKFASQISPYNKNKSKKDAQLERLKQHSKAAAFILQSYLDYIAFQKDL